MGTAVELATAYVSVVPSARGFGASLAGQIEPQLAAAGRSGGAKMAKGIEDGAARSKSAIGGVTAPMLKIGAAVGIAAWFKGGVEKAEAVHKQMAGIEQTIISSHGAAGVTADDISHLTSKLSDANTVTGSFARGAEEVLLRFTQIKNAGADKVFDRATQAAIDFAVATGQDSASTAKLLGFALNDPEKGMMRLTRAGVSFTQQQKEQIKTLVESGHLVEAQSQILDLFNQKFGGQAKARATDMDKLKLEMARVQTSAGQTILPVLEEMAHAGADVAQVFEHIPGPLRGVIGVGGAGVVTYALFGSTLKKVAGNIGDIVHAGRGMLGISKATTVAVEVETAAEEANTVAQGANTAATEAGASARMASLGTWASIALGIGAATLAANALSDALQPVGPSIDATQNSLLAMGRTGEQAGVLGGDGLDKLAVKMDHVANLWSGPSGVVNKIGHGIVKIGTLGMAHDPIDNLKKSVDNVDKSLAHLVESGHGKEAARAFDLIAAAGKRQGLSIAQIKAEFDDYGAATAAAAAGGTNLGAALDAIDQKAQAARDHLKEVTDNAATVLDRESAGSVARDKLSSAENDFAQTLADARKAGYNKDFTDLRNTDQTSIDLRNKMRDVRGAAQDLTTAWHKAGEKGEVLRAKEAALAFELAHYGDQVGLTLDQNKRLVASIDTIAAAWDRVARAQWLATHPDIPEAAPATPVPMKPPAGSHPMGPYPSPSKPGSVPPGVLTPFMGPKASVSVNVWGVTDPMQVGNIVASKQRWATTGRTGR